MPFFKFNTEDDMANKNSSSYNSDDKYGAIEISNEIGFVSPEG